MLDASRRRLVTQRLAGAARHDGPIAAVRLEIGRLSGLVADSVRFCFEIVASGTGLQGARPDIDEPPGAGVLSNVR